MTEYAQTLQAIFEYVDFSRTRQTPYNADTYNLLRMYELCRRLGDPQVDAATLHIAGSKGKGSTSAMIAAILQAAGLRTGLYTSPHLHTFRERIRLDGVLISQEEVVRLWRQMYPTVRSLPGTTTFEIITALAFIYFSQQQVDCTVLEVGLGGRLDATNVVTPCVCAITPLSLEHTNLLGPTLRHIAHEKAGILKPGVPAIIAPQQAEAMAVIRQRAKQVAAPLQRLGREWRWRVRQTTTAGVYFDVIGPGVRYDDLYLPLVGAHQAVNGTLAVALAHAMQIQGYDIPPAAVRAGLRQTRWPGRLECLNTSPLIITDSAHNRHSAETLHAALQLFPHRRRFLLFGASADKDIHGMMEALGPEAAGIIITRSFHPRAAAPEELAAIVRHILPDRPIYTAPDTPSALQKALSLAAADDLILVTGSVFVVADARQSWLALHPDAFPADDWAHFAEPIDGDFTPMLPGPEALRTHPATLAVAV